MHKAFPLFIIFACLHTAVFADKGVETDYPIEDFSLDGYRVPMPEFVEPDKQTKLFSGSLEFPIKMQYDVCLFFDGHKLDFEKHESSKTIQFSFVAPKQVQTMYLIITSQLALQAEQGNTLKHFCVPAGQACIGYKLTADRQSDGEGERDILTWHIKEWSLSGGLVPEHSLVFLFDPELIEGLKVLSWKPENVFRIIPTIIIKQMIAVQDGASGEQLRPVTKQDLQRAVVASRMASLDIVAFHEDDSKKEKVQAKEAS